MLLTVLRAFLKPCTFMSGISGLFEKYNQTFSRQRGDVEFHSVEPTRKKSQPVSSRNGTCDVRHVGTGVDYTLPRPFPNKNFFFTASRYILSIVVQVQCILTRVGRLSYIPCGRYERKFNPIRTGDVKHGESETTLHLPPPSLWLWSG